MAGATTGLRRTPSWWFDRTVCGLGLLLFAWACANARPDGVGVVLLSAVGVTLIVVLARFPLVLDDGDGSMEIGFDSAVLMFLLCILEPWDALVIWSLGVLVTQLTSGKRLCAVLFNIGVGILAGGLAAGVLTSVRAGQVGSPRELLAVGLAAVCYFTTDYVLTAVSLALTSATPLRSHLHLGQPGTLLVVVCFVPFNTLGYLAAVVQRSAPLWTLGLLAVPVATLLVASRALTRGNENARRLAVLFDAAGRAQSLHDPRAVTEGLLEDARQLLRLTDVELRDHPPGPGEIGSEVRGGKGTSWIVTRTRVRARAGAGADQQALDALAAVSSDAFSRLQMTDEMLHVARHDPLTDLPNRGILLDRVDLALQSARLVQTRPALLFIDLDGFKPINDQFGHAAGDAVLVEVAQRLRACTRDGDTVARLGGDEFAVLFEGVEPHDVMATAQRILTALTEGVVVHSHEVPLSASIGIAYGDPHSGDPMSVLRNADLAMYEAKSSGGASYVEYAVSLGRARLERLELVEELRYAVARSHISLVYQPVVEVATGRIHGVEALARWRLGDTDISPDVFIRLAEETGLVVPLGDQVLARAASDAASMQEAAGGPISMSVNVSVQQLLEPRFLESVRRAVVNMGTIPLVLELTERQGVGDDPAVLHAMRTICDLGVQFAIDDFGVGFSSLSYLQSVPAQIIKADASLSANIDQDERACALLGSIVTMCRALGLSVIVEGVERETQLARLRDDVDAPYAQGYLMHRPLRLPELLAVVRKERDQRSLLAAHPL